MKSLIVLVGDNDDPKSGQDSYRIAMPPQIEAIIDQVYPLPDGTWRKIGTHEVVLSGCNVVKARDLDGASPEETWIWEERRFQRAGKLTIVKDGLHPEGLYAKKDITPLLPNGEGPYCEFVVSGLPSTPGVYAFFVGGTLRYIGRAKNLHKRFAQGYGHISPRNCYVGGQATNIRLNKKVLEISHEGVEIAVFYHVTPDYVALESRMIQYLQPPWNIQGIITK